MNIKSWPMYVQLMPMLQINIFTDVFISASDNPRHPGAGAVDHLRGGAARGVEDSRPASGGGLHLGRPLDLVLGPSVLEVGGVGSGHVCGRLEHQINLKLEVHRLQLVVRQGIVDSCSRVPQFDLHKYLLVLLQLDFRRQEE